jgi:hypothetical protein
MYELKHLRNKRNFSLEKSFYFADKAYSDIRELVCHERPVIFLLYYFYGLPVPYHLLLDRFWFSLNDQGEFDNRSNALNHFFFETGICRPQSDRLITGGMGKILADHCCESTAMIVPTVKHVGGDRLVTAVLVEGDGDHALVSSLRGDDFYIRRSEDLSMLQGRLALEDGHLSFMKVVLEGDNALIRDETAFYQAQKNFAVKAVAEARAEFHRHIGGKNYQVGSSALASYLANRMEDLALYSKQLEAGFHNVLLAKVLWPMTFCFLPYVIAVRRIAEGEETNKNVLSLTQEITDRCGLAANLGHLYARRPTKQASDRFFKVLKDIVETYRDLEKITLADKG